MVHCQGELPACFSRHTWMLPCDLAEDAGGGGGRFLSRRSLFWVQQKPFGVQKKVRRLQNAKCPAVGAVLETPEA